MELMLIDICSYCDKDGKHVEITFEETKDKKNRVYLKGVCPDCGRTTKKWPKKEETPDTPADTPADIPEDIPEISQGDTIPEEEEVIEPKDQELITEEEEEEEDKDKKPLPIALIIAVSVILVLVIVSLWLFTQYLEYQKIKEEKHGDKEG